MLFIHGTAGFRTQSATQMTHCASRGFIVVASDHPHLELKYVLAVDLGDDLPGDATKVLDALDGPKDESAFLEGHIAGDRKAIAGHIAGGAAVAGFGGRAGVRALIPMVAVGAEAGAAFQSTLVLGALDDGVIDYDGQKSGYESTPAAKRLVGLENAGHLAFSDLCFIGREQGASCRWPATTTRCRCAR